MSDTGRPASIGQSIPRLDGDEKARGATSYISDRTPEGLWYGGTVRAPVAHGTLTGLTWDPGFDWDQVVRITAADIPGDNVIPIIQDDQPCLVERTVNYFGEPVALIAAPTEALLKTALDAVTVEVDAASPLVGLSTALDRWRADPDSVSVLHEIAINKGDPAVGFLAAEQVLEGEFWTGAQEHAYLETQAMLAEPRDVGITVHGSMQCPYYVQPAVARVLGVDPADAVIIQAPTGGAFGGKEDFPSLLAAHAALLARAADRPVRMCLDRQEDLAFTTKRHPSYSQLKLGVRKDGVFTALEGEFVLDGGAYVTVSPVVLARGVLHATGAYRCPHVKLTARVLKTHVMPYGAFRGFGAPQSHFAIESLVDEAADRFELDPDELRARNVLRQGDVTATGQILDESVGAEACLEAVVHACQYARRRRALERENTLAAEVKRGLGLALFFHGGAFTGGGEGRIGARVALELTAEGTVEIRMAGTELGQGSRTTLSQIVADACGIPFDRVRCNLPDTSVVPDSGPTVASRTIQVVGRLLQLAGHELAAEVSRRMGGAFSRDEDHWAELAAGALSHGPLRIEQRYQQPPDLVWDEDTYQGDAYPSYSWGAVAAEISIDPVTCMVTPEEIWCAVEIGRAINPTVVRGQIEGGLVQALGYGLSEQLTVTPEGRVLEDRFQNYIIPTSADVPPLHVMVLEQPFSGGPNGAKGLGELPMNGLAPALRNAIFHALGLGLDTIPMIPERILAALKRQAGR